MPIDPSYFHVLASNLMLSFHAGRNFEGSFGSKCLPPSLYTGELGWYDKCHIGDVKGGIWSEHTSIMKFMNGPLMERREI